MVRPIIQQLQPVYERKTTPVQSFEASSSLPDITRKQQKQTLSNTKTRMAVYIESFLSL
jgi:hypothetical protein